MFVMSGSGESFWKTVWIIVFFIIFVAPNMEYVRAIWGYVNGEIADGLKHGNLSDKAPLDIVYQFARKQQRDEYNAQYEDVADKYNELALSVRRLSRIKRFRDELVARGVPAYFQSAAMYINRYRLDRSAENMTDAKIYLEDINDLLTKLTKPWLIGWMIFVASFAFVVGLMVKHKESEDLDGLAQDMMQRSRVGFVRSYMLPTGILSAWYFWQFDPLFTLFGFYFVIPLTFLWFIVPYVMAKSSI